jgi:hypothetical protein
VDDRIFSANEAGVDEVMRDKRVSFWAACGLEAREFPQFLQKRASGGFNVPQFKQAWSSCFPQFWQKRASAGFSNEQFVHFIRDISPHTF